MARKQDHASHVTRVFLARHPVKHIKWNSWAKSNLWFSRLVSQIMEQKRLCWGATTFIASPLSHSFHNLCITGHDGRSHTVYYFQAILSLGIGTHSFHILCITGHQLWWAEFHFAPFPSIWRFCFIKQKCFFSSCCSIWDTKLLHPKGQAIKCFNIYAIW